MESVKRSLEELFGLYPPLSSVLVNICEHGAFILIPYCITAGALDFDILDPCPLTRLEDIKSNRNWDAAVWRRSIARMIPALIVK